MEQNQMNNWYLYKITYNVNGKQYIGVRKHINPLTDNYMGSGKMLQYAYEKYGIQNFTKQIIFTELNRQQAFEVESFIVDKNYVKRTDTYNITIGGRGGWHIPDRQATNKKISQALKGHINSEQARRKMSQAKKGKPSPRKGKTLSQETRAKISDSKTGVSIIQPKDKDKSFYKTPQYKDKQRQNALRQWEKQHNKTK